jgi:hypothetical protein
MLILHVRFDSRGTPHGLQRPLCKIIVAFLLENSRPICKASSASFNGLARTFVLGSFQESFAGPFPVLDLHDDLNRTGSAEQICVLAPN